MKKLKIMIIIVLIIIVILGVLIVFKINTPNGESQMKSNNIAQEVDEIEEQPLTEKVNQNENNISEKNFYTVMKCINNYLNEKAIFVPTGIRFDEGITKDKYLVEGYAVDNDYNVINNNIYLYVTLDNINKTFLIEQIAQLDGNFENIKIENEEKEIEVKDNNSFDNIIINDDNIVNECFGYFRINLLVNSDYIYSNLDQEYKQTKFKNKEDFNEYISDNKAKYENMVILKYAKEIEGENIKYTFVDNYGNYYVLKNINSNVKFNILLDDYTIENDKYKQNYEKATEEQKVYANIEKFIKMLNNNDYKAMYDVLNNNFKNNNFNTLNEFKEYIKNNFFSYNVLAAKADISKEGKYYVCTISIKDNESVGAEEITKRFIVSLKEGTNFEMAFNIE